MPIATKLAVFCRNQLTVIAAIKYLAAIAERQGYSDVSSRVASTLTALDRNVSIIAEVVTEPGWERARQGPRRGDSAGKESP